MMRIQIERGFVALMSVIIISAIMLSIIFTLNLSSFFARFDALGTENKRVSLGLAEACIEAAKLKVAQNAAYAPASGGDSVTVSTSNTCRICRVTANGGNSYTIATRAVTSGSYSNLEITGTITASAFAVTNWAE